MYEKYTEYQRVHSLKTDPTQIKKIVDIMTESSPDSKITIGLNDLYQTLLKSPMMRTSDIEQI